MAQVSSDNCTKHKHIKPVAVAHDREVLSFSTRNNNNKRKIGNEDDNDDDTTGDNVHGDERIRIQRRIAEQSHWCSCTFHDFRSSTIHRTALCTVRLIRTVVRD